MKRLDDQQGWELLLYTNKKYESEPTITFMLDLDSKTPSVTVSEKRKKKNSVPFQFSMHVKCILWSLSMTSIKAQLQHKTALVLLLWQTFYPCLKPAELLILLPRCLSWAAQFDENCCNFFCVSATFSTYFCIYFGFQPVLEIPGSQRKKCDQQY